MTTLLLLGALSAPALAATPAADIPLVLVEAGWTPDALETALGSEDWRVRHDAAVARLWRDQPELSSDLWAVQPQPTRAGFLRFWGGVVDEPGADAMLLERLMTGDEDAQVRHALVDAIARSGTDYADAFVVLMPLEADGWVRAAFVQSLRKTDSTQALPMFRQGLADPVGLVRAEAARSAGWHADGDRLTGELIAALEDSDTEVRAAAARSLGVLRIDAAFGPVSGLLADDDAEVRLQALHAVERIDPDRARPIAAPLLSDGDARVARLAVRVAER